MGSARVLAVWAVIEPATFGFSGGVVAYAAFSYQVDGQNGWEITTSASISSRSSLESSPSLSEVTTSVSRLHQPSLTFCRDALHRGSERREVHPAQVPHDASTHASQV
jgi:hypothetical protein